MIPNSVSGIHEITWDAYKGLPRVNHSRLKLCKKSPWHYQNPRAWKEKPEFEFGTALHALILEPESFDDMYTVEPEGSKNSNAYKAAVKEIESSGRKALSDTDFKRLFNMHEAILGDPTSRALFEAGKAEQTLLWEWDGIPCKARLDWLPDAIPNVIVDLKTTKDAHPDRLKSAVLDFCYHTQEAFYRAGWQSVFGKDADGFVFVFCEKPDDPEDTPLPPQHYELPPDYRRAGEKAVRAWMNKLKECLALPQGQPWPHYTTGIELLTPPYWFKG